MPESDPTPIRPPENGAPPPAAAKLSPDLDHERKVPEGEPTQSFDVPAPENVAAAIAALGASVEGLAVEVEMQRRRNAKVERQLIMLCGVATYLVWKFATKTPSMKGEASVLADAVSE